MESIRHAKNEERKKTYSESHIRKCPVSIEQGVQAGSIIIWGLGDFERPYRDEARISGLGDTKNSQPDQTKQHVRRKIGCLTKWKAVHHEALDLLL